MKDENNTQRSISYKGYKNGPLNIPELGSVAYVVSTNWIEFGHSFGKYRSRVGSEARLIECIHIIYYGIMHVSFITVEYV